MITAQPKEPLVPVYRYSQFGNQTSQVVPGLDFLNTAYAFNTRAYSTPGWSDPSPTTSTIGYPRVYCPYVTNVFAQQSTFVDGSGNTYIFAQAASTLTVATPPQVYDRFGTLRATGQVNTASLTSNYYVIYVSADGFTDLWIANLSATAAAALITDTAASGTTGNTNYTPLGQIDSEGNFVLMFTLGLNTGTFRAYDRNNISFGPLFSATTSAQAYIVKYSKTGLNTDSNTWAARLVNNGGGAAVTTNAVRVLNFQFDSLNNIVALLSVSNLTTGSTAANFNSFSADGSSFGTTIALMTSTLVDATTTIVVKYNKSGVGQWNSYCQLSSGTATPANPFFGSNLAVLPNNRIAFAFRVTRTSTLGANFVVYGSDNAAIGNSPLALNVPASGTSLYTVTVLLTADGVAATSQRAILQTATGDAARSTVPFAIVPFGNEFYVVGYSSAATAGADFTLTAGAPNTDSSAITSVVPSNTANAGVTQQFRQLIYAIKYDSSCVPQWIGTIRASQTATAANYVSFAGSATPETSTNASAVVQDLRAIVDGQGNIIITGSYGPLGAAAAGLVQTFSTASATPNVGQKSQNCPATLTVTEVFLAKFLANGTQSYVARVGIDQAGTNTVTNPNQIIVDSNNNVIITARWTDVNCGIYNDLADVTPAVILPGINSAQTNILVVRFNTILQGAANNVGYIRFTSATGTIAINNFLLALDSAQNIILAGTYSGVGGAPVPSNNVEFYNFGNIVSPFATRTNTVVTGTTSDIYICKLTFSSTGQSPWVAKISGSSTDGFGLAASLTNYQTPVSYLRDTAIDRIILMGTTNAAGSSPIIYDATDAAIVSLPSLGVQAITYLPSYPFNGVSALN
jgi:hypothetical protein